MRVVVSKHWEGNHLSGRTVHRSEQTNDFFRPNVINRTDVVKTRAHNDLELQKRSFGDFFSHFWLQRTFQE